MGFYNLKAVPLQISFNIVVRPRMEVQQIFPYNQNLRAFPAAVIGHLLHKLNGPGKAFLGPGDSMALQPIAQGVHSLLKGLIGASRRKFVWTNLSQQSLQGVNHRQGKGNAHGSHQVHLESRMNLMGILVIIGKNRHLPKARVI